MGPSVAAREESGEPVGEDASEQRGQHDSIVAPVGEDLLDSHRPNKETKTSLNSVVPNRISVAPGSTSMRPALCAT